jgi:hypothetical protein
MDTGPDWWAANDPGIVTGPMQTQSTEQGGITGNSTPTVSGFPAGIYGQQSGALSGGGGPTPGQEQQWFMQLVGDRPWNQQTFNELAPTLQRYGFHITPPNAAGDQTKIQLPTGEWVRVGFGEGHPVWIPQTDRQGNNLYGPNGNAATGTGINSPWAIPAPFQSPSLQDFQQNDPGLQARLALGQQALEHSAAAQGSLLSGGFQKSLNKFAQDYGSAEYGNAYNRAYQNYMTNFNVQSQTPWNRYQDILNRGVQSTGILANAGKVPPQSS